jgi:aconitate hydratase
MYLGVRAVMAKGIERIHMANLINFGILPLIFKNAEDYERIQSGQELEIQDIHAQLQRPEIIVVNRAGQQTFSTRHSLTPRQVEIVLSGGLLNYAGKA